MFSCAFARYLISHSIRGKIPVLLAVLALSLPARAVETPPPGSPHPSQEGYQLVWQDEFSGTALDRTKWRAVDDPTLGTYGHGNGEAQAYLDSEGQTFRVREGQLTITAHHDPEALYPLRDKPGGPVTKQADGQDFASAKLTTETLYSFTYGIIEARIRNPVADKGGGTAIPVWPAFWMLPEASTAPYDGYWDKVALDGKREWARSTWPYSGEIDIMEMSGRATRLYHAGAVYHTSPKRWTVGHIGWYSHYRRFDGAINPKQWIADQKLDGSLQPRPGQKSYVSGYHIYGCKWTADRLIFMLDGKEWGPGLDLRDPSKFGGRKIYRDYPFYLILNLAIGGNYFGVWGPRDPGPDKKRPNELYDFTRFPQSMQVDWVRVYQSR